MKELSIEEKAKAYDKIAEKAKMEKEKSRNLGLLEFIEENFPELTESRDERIRKSLINMFKGYNIQKVGDFTDKQIIAWLEKQISQDNAEDVDILHRFSFYSYKDEPNVLYLSGLYVNEECRNKGIGTKILEIADEVAKSLDCYAIRLKTKKDSDAERLYRTHGYNSIATKDKDETWLEKQGEQKEINLIEILKHYPKETELYSPLYGKLWLAEVDEKNEIIICYKHKLEEGCTRAILEQEDTMSFYSNGTTGMPDFNVSKDCMLFLYDIEKQNDLSKWNIKYAVPGDILAGELDGYSSPFVAIFKEYGLDFFNSYCSLNIGGDFNAFENTGHSIFNIHPATKEQRDLLFQKMKEAGYEWDAEKKELKKVKQKPAKEHNICDTCEEKASCVNPCPIKLVEQNPTWSEEDDIMVHDIDYALRCQITYPISRLQSMSAWILNLKYRVRLKQEWSEEDDRIINNIGAYLNCYGNYIVDSNEEKAKDVYKSADWLKHLKDRVQLQNIWEPSDEQMDALRYVTNFDYGGYKATLVSLYEQLKKLKKE